MSVARYGHEWRNTRLSGEWVCSICGYETDAFMAAALHASGELPTCHDVIADGIAKRNATAPEVTRLVLTADPYVCDVDLYMRSRSYDGWHDIITGRYDEPGQCQKCGNYCMYVADMDAWETITHTIPEHPYT